MLAVVASVAERAVASVLFVRLSCANAAVLARLVGEADVVDLVAVSSSVTRTADSCWRSACGFDVGLKGVKKLIIFKLFFEYFERNHSKLCYKFCSKISKLIDK